jgi:hypothetical protein
MAVLLYSEISDLVLDRIQANVATDAPFTAAEILRHINEAYADVYQISGGGFKLVAASNIWSGGGTASLAAQRALLPSIQTIDQIIQVWASTVVTSDGAESGDVPLDRVDYATINRLHASSGLGTYATPKVYAIIRGVATDTTTNLPTLYWWPSKAGFYFPASYVELFDPFDGGASDYPNVNDIESRDIALLAAARMAPLVGASEFVPAIMMDVSERTRAALDRKLQALMDARQDK